MKFTYTDYSEEVMFKDITTDGSYLYYVSDYLDSSYNLHVEVTKLDMDGEYISNYEMYMSGWFETYYNYRIALHDGKVYVGSTYYDTLSLHFVFDMGSGDSTFYYVDAYWSIGGMVEDNSGDLWIALMSSSYVYLWNINTYNIYGLDEYGSVFDLVKGRNTNLIMFWSDWTYSYISIF